MTVTTLFVPGLILSNNPGRVKIMHVIALDNWGNISFTKVLTRKYYYHVAKINQYQHQMQQTGIQV